MKDKYRLGKKNQCAILEVETGHEYLVFPHNKAEEVKFVVEQLNKKEQAKSKLAKFNKFVDLIHRLVVVLTVLTGAGMAFVYISWFREYFMYYTGIINIVWLIYVCFRKLN